MYRYQAYAQRHRQVTSVSLGNRLVNYKCTKCRTHWLSLWKGWSCYRKAIFPLLIAGHEMKDLFQMGRGLLLYLCTKFGFNQIRAKTTTSAVSPASCLYNLCSFHKPNITVESFLFTFSQTSILHTAFSSSMTYISLCKLLKSFICSNRKGMNTNSVLSDPLVSNQPAVLTMIILIVKIKL